jgi:hypothetical protein
MKQLEDTLTIDMLDPAKPKAGRPRAKNPLTPAQRQAARRARLAKAGRAFITVEVSTDIILRMKELGIGTQTEKNAYVESLLHAALFDKGTTAQGAEAA